jgi:hypothetical protein
VNNNDPLQFYKAIEYHFQREAPAGSLLFFELSTQAEQIVTYFSELNRYTLQTKNDMYGKLRMLCLIKL